MVVEVLLKFLIIEILPLDCLDALKLPFFDDGLVIDFIDFLLDYSADGITGVTVTEIICFCMLLLFFAICALFFSFRMC